MDTILRAVVAYLVLLLLIRVTSRRAAGPATPFQLILIFLFGGMTIQAVVSDDRSLTNALLAAMTISWAHITIARLKTRFPAVGRIVDGVPIVLVENGKWHGDRLSHLSLHDADIIASARMKGIMRRDEIRHAVFERNGDIAVFRKDTDGDGEN